MTFEGVNRIYLGDAVKVLQTLPDGCIQTCVTSPPYFGLRDYGADGQIGAEKTPTEYVAALVKVFREVWRVLRDDGTLWINLGDTYSADRTKQVVDSKHKDVGNNGGMSSKAIGLPPKNLIGIPWLVAFALQNAGWILRRDIVWNKPNAMPESVNDRPTTAHEYMFLLSKSSKYYYDAAAIAETTSEGMRNKRSVWDVNTEASRSGHPAGFPFHLVEPCILAGCPVGGVVLDPFIGSGKTALVARYHKRQYIGIEINPKFVTMANRALRLPLERLPAVETNVYDLPLFAGGS